MTTALVSTMASPTERRRAAGKKAARRRTSKAAATTRADHVNRRAGLRAISTNPNDAIPPGHTESVSTCLRPPVSFILGRLGPPVSEPSGLAGGKASLPDQTPLRVMRRRSGGSAVTCCQRQSDAAAPRSCTLRASATSTARCRASDAGAGSEPVAGSGGHDGEGTRRASPSNPPATVGH